MESVYSAVGTESLHKTDTLRLERVNIKSDLKRMWRDSVNWVHRSQDRVKWQDHLNMTLKSFGFHERQNIPV
jgi:hypothetical protein